MRGASVSPTAFPADRTALVANVKDKVDMSASPQTINWRAQRQ
jgi:predicted component of type VI protein secretion system